MGMTGYLQHGRDWTMTRQAIIRLAARLGRPFTYGELGAEIEEHDGLRIDGRGYAGVLEAVARKQQSTEPLWTTMVINAETGEPGEGLWSANSGDRRYADAGALSPSRRAAWLERQRAWCVAAARVEVDPLDRQLHEAKALAREDARSALIDLLLEDHREPRQSS
jgi:hypothetical protein